MPQLLRFSDFPECRQVRIIGKGSASGLKEKCKKFFQQNADDNNLLCIISDEKDWEVLYPVISDGNGKKQHPKDCRGKGKGKGWTWESDKEEVENHKTFTAQLKKACGAVCYADDEELGDFEEDTDELPAETEAAEAAENEEGDNELQKLAACREVIQKNFELFLKTYQKKFGKEFASSEDVTMFYREAADIEKVQLWNEEAASRNVLIDPCAFNEMILGNDEDPDIVILGKNPGAAGIDFIKEEDFFNDCFDELEQRKKVQEKKLFYPLVSKEVMEKLPWFSNRLIFGSVSDSNAPAGILSRFVSGKKIKEVCAEKFAGRIVSLELVPYHTVRFQGGKKLLRQFGVVDKVKAVVEKAIRRKAVILCPYFGAVKMWLEHVKALENYEFFYTTHFRYGQTDAAQDGNMNIAALRHYSKIGTPRSEEENCDAVFKRLEELGWK